MNSSHIADLRTILERTLGDGPTGSPTPVSGGCIHHTYRWGPFFLKLNEPSHHATFQAEASCLQAIGRTNTIRVPEVITHGSTTGQAYLVLEHLDLVSTGDESRLGEQLAALHQHTADQFGFAEDNFIGATPQPNTWTDDWPTFFAESRLAHLIHLLADRGESFPGADRLLSRLPELLPPDPTASLLHGDLWAGNKAYLPDGTPVLFDPACYHGHAAADIAMTTLFGGFSGRFYEAYRAHSDLDDPSLHDLYNLYHILNHALLFGGSYLSQARDTIGRLA